MDMPRRSQCPISFTLDLIGDKWSLLILRDIILFAKKYYHEFETSPESISTNILADRLKKLEAAQLILRAQDPENKKRVIYSPTPAALDLIPLLVEILIWGSKYDEKSKVSEERVKKIKKNKQAFIKKVRSSFNL